MIKAFTASRLRIVPVWFNLDADFKLIVSVQTGSLQGMAADFTLRAEGEDDPLFTVSSLGSPAIKLNQPRPGSLTVRVRSSLFAAGLPLHPRWRYVLRMWHLAADMDEEAAIYRVQEGPAFVRPRIAATVALSVLQNYFEVTNTDGVLTFDPQGSATVVEEGEVLIFDNYDQGAVTSGPVIVFHQPGS